MDGSKICIIPLRNFKAKRLCGSLVKPFDDVALSIRNDQTVSAIACDIAKNGAWLIRLLSSEWRSAF